MVASCKVKVALKRSHAAETGIFVPVSDERVRTSDCRSVEERGQISPASASLVAVAIGSRLVVRHLRLDDSLEINPERC